MSGRRIASLLLVSVVVLLPSARQCPSRDDVPSTPSDGRLRPVPADAVPVPADYDGDGLTDIAFKGANGIWYIDLAVCDVDPETACADALDDDGDGQVND